MFFAKPCIIGTGPPSLAKGDRIANIIGVSVPLILRETAQHSGRYKVVGAAFADDLMEWGWPKKREEHEETRYVSGGKDGPYEKRRTVVKYVPWPKSYIGLAWTTTFDRIVLV